MRRRDAYSPHGGRYVPRANAIAGHSARINKRIGRRAEDAGKTCAERLLAAHPDPWLNPAMIGVDWGTTNLRAFRIAPDGTVRDRIERPAGIIHVPPGGFADVLRAAVGPWLADGETAVLLSGMVGSRQGWREAAYLPCPADPATLAQGLVSIPFEGAKVRLIPGLSDTDEAGTPEVMRGEETQLAGVLAELPAEALVCLPGSHAKWVTVRHGRIVAFRTYLSGEAFAAIRAGTILGRMMPDAPHDPEAFARGAARATSEGHLLHHLFGVRTLGLTGALADTASASYLSGLLIGHEVRAALEGAARVWLIGSPTLTAHYATVIAAAGAEVTILAEDAAASGLALIGRSAAWT